MSFACEPHDQATDDPERIENNHFAVLFVIFLCGLLNCSWST